MRIFALVLLLSLKLFAIDATLEIVKNTNKIPYIVVERLDSDNADFGTKILKMLVADLKVSGHFQANDGGVVKPTHITYKDYADKKIDLLAQIKVSKSSTTSMILMPQNTYIQKIIQKMN